MKVNIGILNHVNAYVAQKIALQTKSGTGRPAHVNVYLIKLVIKDSNGTVHFANVYATQTLIALLNYNLITELDQLIGISKHVPVFAHTLVRLKLLRMRDHGLIA
jgi:hypothetical protein